MEGKDIKEAKLQKEKAEKEEKQAKKAEKRIADAMLVEENIKKKKERKSIIDVEMVEMEETVHDEEYIHVERKKETKMTTIKMDLFVAELTRYGISDRAGAAVWNGVVKTLEDNEILMKEDETSITENLTVDRYKIRREKDSFGNRGMRLEGNIIFW